MSTLTNQIKAQFERDGFYLAKGVYSPDEVATLEKSFDHIVAQLMAADENINARWSGPEMDKMGAQNTVILHTHQVHEFSNDWLNAVLHKKFLDITEQLIGPDIILHHTKLFQKPAEMGAPFPMHQDYSYFASYKDSMIAGVIFVSDATDEMGCLRVYPGSHKLGRVEGSHGRVESLMLTDYPIEKSTPIEVQAGDVVFFHYFTVHGSLPNRSNRIRKSVLVQMHAGDDEIEEGNRHPNARLVLRGWNHKMTRSKANQLH
jgi:ectoine hydroxylase-related dioxygenase (phytanoyl-CoA dioxygenase family)